MSEIRNQNKLKDNSRFNRWVNNLDDKDKTLDRGVRKRKWILIITGIFSLFVLSFVLFPTINVNPEKLDSSIVVLETANPNSSSRSAFELPVDSFETHLKTIIDETSMSQNIQQKKE